jgi:AcrR family transcriptional regulator
MAGTRGKRRSLGRQDWVGAAQRSLIGAGISSVKIERLASELGASRGSFYWHFSGHAELLDELLASWVDTNTKPFRKVLETDQDRPLIQALRYSQVWLNGSFDPDFDAAIRDWARHAGHVAESVRRIDDERVEILILLFERLGYGPTEALVRARTSYYHQVGYYALKVVQTLEERRALFPAYFRVLTGFPIPRE